jgi:hypothetical protein
MNDIGTIIFLICIMIILILLIKYVVGDYSVKSIELLEEKEFEKTDKNGMIINKTIVYTYKYTYNNDKIKLKIKTIKL